MLLRRVIEHVKAQNWTAVALDFVIVVVGVFIGIQVANWNETRTDRESERVVLEEMRTALARDLALLEQALDRYRIIEERVPILLEHLRDEKTYSPELDSYFGTLYGAWGVELNRSAYESLKSRGLELISDNELRSQIAQIYERSYVRAEYALNQERSIIMEVLRPYFLIHFKDLRFNETATPLDYEALLTDIEFLNMADYRVQVVRQNDIPLLSESIAEVSLLIDGLDAKLDG